MRGRGSALRDRGSAMHDRASAMRGRGSAMHDRGSTMRGRGSAGARKSLRKLSSMTGQLIVSNENFPKSKTLICAVPCSRCG